ncbi:hypothetical protein [Hyphomicrobium sp.]|uniref:hypothetical protein n=1 Tax=Hyphomicrobium sp. TaxID=82 RepID=UPI002C649597|nr:hypothetical protein [Hyphomicrobium sp.]HRQ27329.1 hypothetical protein [Hyphomicrobium sp.]
MTDANFALTADSDFDDLPRTLRRERALRDREARERKAREERERDGPSLDRLGEPPSYLARSFPPPVAYGDDPIPASVQRFDVPFVKLAAFFLKAVLAAIPALILLGVILYFAGKGLEAYFPDLVRMKILISFPGG